MAEQPYPLTAKTFKEAMRQVQQLMDDLYRERLAGAQVGDVFQVNNQSDVLTLTLLTNSGLRKSGGALGVLVDPLGPVVVGTGGVNVSVVSATMKGVVPLIPGDGTKYFSGDGTYSIPAASGIWPVGTVYFTTSTDDPAITFGFGVWSKLYEGIIPSFPITFSGEYGVVTNITQSGTKVYGWERTS